MSALAAGPLDLSRVRSILCVAGHNILCHLDGARVSGADAVMLDLEDAVPIEAKSDALALVAERLLPADIVRINHPSSPYFAEEARLLRGARCIMVPKVESVDDLITVYEAVGDIPLIAAIESPTAMWNLRGIVGGWTSLVGLAFGRADFLAAIPPAASDLADYAACAVTAAAAYRGIHATDAPCYDLRPGRLPDEIRRSRRQGFHSKGCICPSQALIVNAGMRPAENERRAARELLDRARGGATRIGTQIAAPPTLALAERIVAC